MRSHRVLRSWRRAVEDSDTPSAYEQEVERLRMLRRLARERLQQQPEELPAWLQDTLQLLTNFAPVVVLLFLAWVLYQIANPVNDVVPRGKMPSLAEWLKSRSPPRSPGNYGGRPPPPREARAPKISAAAAAAAGADGKWASLGVSLGTVSSSLQLWQVYAFASREILEEVPSMLFERNYIVSLLLKLSSFPRVYSNWGKYESCAIDEVTLGANGTVLGRLNGDERSVPIDEGKPERELVLDCGQMIEDYGLSLVARDGSDRIVGAAVLRVKRLPEGCHVDYDNQDPEVVCTVDIDAVYEAAGLEAVAYLESIAVARGWRGSGLAAWLLEFVEEKARTWGLGILALHVHRDNWSALHFYQRRGFEVTSDWLGWGPDFFLLVKPLLSSP